MTQTNSYRKLLSTAIIFGGSSVINIFLSLLRIKIAAMILGPVGIGLIGICQSIMTTASSIIGMGIGPAGTRQISAAVSREDIHKLQHVNLALFYGTIVLCFAGGSAFWVLRELIATNILGNKLDANTVGGLGIGVMLMVAVVSQTSFLNGMRNLKILARVNIISAFLSCLIGVSALLILNHNGLFIFIIALPLSSFLVASWYVLKFTGKYPIASKVNEIFKEFKHLIHLGVTFMFAGLIATISQLLVRTIIQQELGAEALGNFQAAWQISITYFAFILSAIGVDYYPRLTAVISNPTATNRMVNEQIEIGLLLGGIIIITMLGLAPWVIELLYSDLFYNTVYILRWQILGDIIKLINFPLSYILLASGNGRSFLITESITYAALVMLTWFFIPIIGIEASGLAYLCMHLIYIPIVYSLAFQRTSFKFSSVVCGHIIVLSATGVLLVTIAFYNAIHGAFFGVLFATCWTIHVLIRLSYKNAINGRIGRFASLIRDTLKLDKFYL